MSHALTYLVSRILSLFLEVSPQTVAFFLGEITKRLPVKHQVAIARGLILFIKRSEVTLGLPHPWLSRGLDTEEFGEDSESNP
jgi:hypothetical protein